MKWIHSIQYVPSIKTLFPAAYKLTKFCRFYLTTLVLIYFNIDYFLFVKYEDESQLQHFSSI